MAVQAVLYRLDRPRSGNPPPICRHADGVLIAQSGDVIQDHHLEVLYFRRRIHVDVSPSPFHVSYTGRRCRGPHYCALTKYTPCAMPEKHHRDATAPADDLTRANLSTGRGSPSSLTRGAHPPPRLPGSLRRRQRERRYIPPSHSLSRARTAPDLPATALSLRPARCPNPPTQSEVRSATVRRRVLRRPPMI